MVICLSLLLFLSVVSCRAQMIISQDTGEAGAHTDGLQPCTDHLRWIPGMFTNRQGYICISAIRLVGGPTEFEGRVELLVNNRWGSMCNTYIDHRTTRVICRMLGKPNALWRSHSQRHAYGGGTGLIWMDSVICSGRESGLEECSHAGFGNTDCNSDYLAAAYCDDLTLDGVRLVGGSSPSEGRLEILVNNTWGTVCGLRSGAEARAVVACKMLGFRNPLVHVKPVSEYGEGTGQIWMTVTHCAGKENTLLDCACTGFFSQNCNHHNDIAVQCANGTIDGVRLAGGGSAAEGRLEVLVNNTWGTVCDYEFDTVDAAVVCKMLGFRNGTAAVRPISLYGEGSGMIWMGYLECRAEMENLADCVHPGFRTISSCSHDRDVAMSCCKSNNWAGFRKVYVPASYQIQDVRLTDGNSSFGRAEVLIGGQWGTVCDDLFNDNAATVFCRMLGWMRGVFSMTHISGGVGRIWLSDVVCHGNETSLDECNMTLDSQICNHREDVWIQCRML